MVQGFAGKILRVDLSDRRIAVDEPNIAFYRTYLGGACFVSYFLLKEIPSGTDALSPENKLIFAVGPMTGLPMAGATRNCVGCKSPLTGGLAKSEVGGHWPMEFKRTGYDALIVEGRAEHPVYLWIHDDGELEIRDASHLWSKTCVEAHDAIAQEVGDRLVRTAMIGPGGENLVRFASIMNDLKDAAGRGGAGAVMGSKNLKAVAARGRKIPQPADAERIREIAQRMGKSYYGHKLFNPELHDLGTGGAMAAYNDAGNLPVRNFSDGYFEAVEKITAGSIRDTIRIGMEGCGACPVRCKKVVEVTEPLAVSRRAGGPEYETLGALGSTCGVEDLVAIAKANERAAFYSLDTISLGVTIAFAMECFENEMITTKDTGGVDLRFGNAEAMLQAIDMIAYRRHIGDILAEGTKQAAAQIGHATREFAMHVKGVEVPMHEPRLKQGMGLMYSVQAHGADHCAGFHDTLYTRENPGMEHLRGAGAVGPLPANDLSVEKVANAKAAHLFRLFQDSMVVCIFLPYTLESLVEVVRAMTGWEYTAYEALRTGERAATLGRVFNIREGLTAADDTLPNRFFTPTPRGALKNTSIDPQAMQEAIRNWYAAMGWDRETGIPTTDRLQELGIGWAAAEL